MKYWEKCIIVSFLSVWAAQVQAQSLLKTDVFVSGTDGYSSYRIPAIVAAKSGALLAFAEARKNSSSDTGDIDLVMKRSFDGGKTWSNLNLIWDDGENVCGNPVPVVDAQSGKLVLVVCWNDGKDTEASIIAGTTSNTRKVFVLSSTDEGVTWSKPLEITSSVKKENWTWYATGPCHGIQLQGKKYRGRILIPANHISALPEKAYHSHCIYSDDKGETWHLGGSADGDGNESTVAELKNGSILLNMRNYNREAGKCRLVAVSKDGGDSFGPSSFDRSLIEPRCQGSLLNYMPQEQLTETLLFSNPSSETKRINMTIQVSRDHGKSWTKKLLIHAGRAAYSDMVVLPHGNIGILYENGLENPYERITFEMLNAKLLQP
jgi:sialidase-1